MSGDFDVLGMRAERTMSQQFRQVSYQVLGTAAVGGLVLGQLDGVRRRAVLPPARLHGSDPQLEIAAGGALEDDIIVTPEPGTILLTGTGLAVVLIGASMKRRKRREARVER